MSISASQARLFKRHGLTVLALVLVFAAYYAFIVPAKRTYFTQRDFRLLAGMSRQIQETVANLCSALTNAAQPPPLVPADDASGPFWEAARRAAPPGGPTDPLPDLNHVKTVLALVPNLTFVDWSTNAPAAAAPSATPGLRLRVVPAGDASWLELTYQGDARCPLRLATRSDLRRWVKPIVNRREFDDVLLTDAQGNVLFQLADAALRLTKLALPTDRSVQTNLLGQAGAEYKVFSQPVQFAAAAPGADPSPTLIPAALCGLVRADRFRNETLAANYTVVLVFVLLALLLVLSWPFLNLWSLGPNDGLRPAEVVWLAFSTLAMTAFLTLLVFDLYTYNRTEDRLDDDLKVFAADLRANFQTELRQAARQMDLLNTQFLAGANAVNQTHLLRRSNLVRASGPASDPYPWLQMATWIDRDGWQRVKWTAADANTPLVNVKHRAYFRYVAEGHPWRLTNENQTVGFCLEPVYSVNTGEYLCLFATAPAQDGRVVATLDLPMLSLVDPVLPAGHGFCVIDADGGVLFHSDERRNLRENFFEECDQDARLRAAVYGRTEDRFDAHYARRVHSLFVTPLPEVPWTLVVFRDEQALATAQVEMVSSAALLFLLGAVLLAAAFGLLYRFGAERHLAWLWPEARHAGTYGLLAAVHLALAFLFIASAWLTPRPGWIVFRGLVMPVLALLLTYLALSREWPAPTWLRWAARRLGLRPAYGVRYVVAMGLLLLVLAVLPTVAFFNAAFLRESRLLVKQAQLQLAHDLEDRAGRLWREVNAVLGRDAPTAELEAVFDQRLTTGWDTYTRFFFDTEYAPLAAGALPATNRWATPTVFDKLLATFRPDYDELAVLTRGVTADQADDQAWWWTSGPGPLVLTKTATHFPGRRFAHGLVITSVPPRLPTPTPLWALGLLAVLAVPFLIACVIARRVLLPPETATSPGASVLLDSARDGRPSPRGPGKYLLLGPPRSGKTERLDEAHFVRLQPGACRRLDLRRAEDRAWLRPTQRDELLRRTDQAIVVDHFEYNLEETHFNRAKLHFLQSLAYDEQRTVILASSVHPLQFRFAAEAAGERPDGPAHPADREAWAELLTVYKPLYSRGPATGLPPTLAGQTSQQARALCQSLWNTCSPGEREILHHVARRRLVRSDGPDLCALVERGLLRRNPLVQFADRTFQRFVLRHYRPGTAVATTADEPAGLWQSLRGPAVTVLVLLAGFLFVTQQELWNQTIGLAAGFTAGIGVLVKAVEQFQKAGLKKLASE